VPATTVPVLFLTGFVRRPSRQGSESDWDGVVNLNLEGVFLCVRHELRHMVAGGGEVIINTR